ncbi:hypothetical protein [Metasolibacillus meyeri]|uniref:hypothetical protein n=1 Tax=Metasolibacillus meyeri TaxID=1071052 RepID=UPI000D2FFF55|nr:hypothetical protein [Metasolibacillus meyeri]
MTFNEALELDRMTIFVADIKTARELKKKYKKVAFKSIRSRNLDALRYVYIDRNLCAAFPEQIKKITKGAWNVEFGRVPDTEVKNAY